MKYITLITISIFLFSCAPQRHCQPPKGSADYAYLIEGNISLDYERTTLVKIRPTMLGYKHLFVTDRGDTIYQTYQTRLCVGECYWVKKV